MTPRSPSSSGGKVSIPAADLAMQRNVPDLATLAVAAGGLECVPGAGAVDENALLPDQPACSRKAGIDLRFRGNVNPAEQATDFTCNPLAQLRVQIEQRDLDPMPGQAPGCCRAQPRGAASDDCRDRGVQLHGMAPFILNATQAVGLNDAARPLAPIAVAQQALVELAGGKPRQ